MRVVRVTLRSSVRRKDGRTCLLVGVMPKTPQRTRRLVIFLLAVTASAKPVSAQPDIELVLIAGRSLRVALDRRLTLHEVGQPVTGTLVEPVYVYDRVVLPVGTHVKGHIARLEPMTKGRRTLAMVQGDFSPHPRATISFDSVVDPEGCSIEIAAIAKNGTLRPRAAVARKPSKDPGQDEQDDTKDGPIAQAREAVTTEARDALALLKQPGKMQKLEELAINQLPYRPEVIPKGTVYDVELHAPVSFGRVIPTPPASPGAVPAADSILTAKLAATIDSAQSPRGTSVSAVLTVPVFTADHLLILPEGTTLTGEVTASTPARHWKRNGKLRVLFAAVQPPAQAPRALLASLYAVEAGPAEGIALDEEGGTTIKNPKSRFIPPALAVLAVRGSIHEHQELDEDPGEPTRLETQGNPGARALGGFFGLGMIGAFVGPLSRPLAIALSVVGAARSIYTNILARGREVTFKADTPIQVRLAPGAPRSK